MVKHLECGRLNVVQMADYIYRECWGEGTIANKQDCDRLNEHVAHILKTTFGR